MVTLKEKQELKNQIVASLRGEKDIRKVVVFGSFLNSDNPRDIDVAVFQDSSEGYIPLAMKYRKMTRAVSKKIPIDIFPIRPDATTRPCFPKLKRVKLYMKNETRKWLDYDPDLEICKTSIEIGLRVEKSALRIIND